MNAKYLKRIILEEIGYVLNEEVFGAQSFVYHGSSTKPKDFIKLLASDQFAPGLGSGSAYGRGLYTVYTYEGSNTERGTYGNYIYKFKINLYGFICFDRDVAKMVYGKELSPGDQARLLGKQLLGQKLDEVMKFYQDEDLSQTTSGPAHDSSRFLTGKVKGILFTGDTDGKVAVVYDPNQLTLFAWKKIDQQTWNKIDVQAVKDFIKRSSSKDFEEDKYSLQKALDNIATLPAGKRKLSGNFEIDEDAPVTSLPDGLQIDGNLRIYDYPNLSSQILPNNLKISGGLVLRSPKITKLPDNLNAGYIDAQGSGLSEIPQKISAETIYLDGTPITQLPDNLQIRNTLGLKNTQIKELPRGLRVDGDLNLTGTQIESLPEDLIVGGDILPVEKYGPMYQEIKKKRGFFGGLKARLKSMIAEEIRNVLNEEKKYISTEEIWKNSWYNRKSN